MPAGYRSIQLISIVHTFCKQSNDNPESVAPEDESADHETSKSQSAHSSSASMSSSSAPSLVHRRSSPSVLSSSRRTPSPSPRRREATSSSSSSTSAPSSMRHRSSPSVLLSNGRQTPSPSPLRRLPRSPYRTTSLEDVSGHSSLQSHRHSTSLHASAASSLLASSHEEENKEENDALGSPNRPPSADDVKSASREDVPKSLTETQVEPVKCVDAQSNNNLIGQILTPSKVHMLYFVF